MRQHLRGEEPQRDGRRRAPGLAVGAIGSRILLPAIGIAMTNGVYERGRSSMLCEKRSR
jgi:hypothetical protein